MKKFVSYRKFYEMRNNISRKSSLNCKYLTLYSFLQNSHLCSDRHEGRQLDSLVWQHHETGPCLALATLSQDPEAESRAGVARSGQGCHALLLFRKSWTQLSLGPALMVTVHQATLNFLINFVISMKKIHCKDTNCIHITEVMHKLQKSYIISTFQHYESCMQ